MTTWSSTNKLPIEYVHRHGGCGSRHEEAVILGLQFSLFGPSGVPAAFAL